MTFRRTALAVAALTTTGLGSACGTDEPAAEHAESETSSVVVIGHRGASGHRPEHTLASYEEAARQGADYIEPDLTVTRDGVLVARHEPYINETTDVEAHPEFADRRTKKTIDGTEYDGWFVEDFTLAELKTLRAKERLPQLRPDNTQYDGRFQIPTFDEVIELRERLSGELGREIGIYPETKHPTYLAAQGIDINALLVAALRAHGLDQAKETVTVQSFEVTNLKQLNSQVGVRLAQLVDDAGSPADSPELKYADMLTPHGLTEIATYADGVAPYKSYVIPRSEDGELLEPTNLVADAHAAGLTVTVWTFRSENEYLPKQFRSGEDPAAHGNSAGEYVAFFEAGVDEVFSDQPDDAVRARAES